MARTLRGGLGGDVIDLPTAKPKHTRVDLRSVNTLTTDLDDESFSLNESLPAEAGGTAELPPPLPGTLGSADVVELSAGDAVRRRAAALAWALLVIALVALTATAAVGGVEWAVVGVAVGAAAALWWAIVPAATAILSVAATNRRVQVAAVAAAVLLFMVVATEGAAWVVVMKVVVSLLLVKLVFDDIRKGAATTAVILEE